MLQQAVATPVMPFINLGCVLHFSFLFPLQVVTRMRMLDGGRAQIDWLLTGQLSALAVAIPVSSVFELNLLTGRVVAHT